MKTSGKGQQFQNNLSTYSGGILVLVEFDLGMGKQVRDAQMTCLVSCSTESRKLKAWICAPCLGHSFFLAIL